SDKITKKINAEIGCSIILAISPPGIVVISSYIITVAIDNSNEYFGFGNSKIPKNIIANNISGRMPNKIGGAIACKTAPILTNNYKITKILVFTYPLSPLLSSSCTFQLYTRCQLRKHAFSITNCMANKKN